MSYNESIPHFPYNDTPVVSVGAAFDKNKNHKITMGMPRISTNVRRFQGLLSKVFFVLDNIAGATKFQFYISEDALGKYPILTSGEIDIDFGIDPTGGLSTSYGTVQSFAGSWEQQPLENKDELYIHFRTDAGTLDVSKSQITWIQ